MIKIYGYTKCSTVKKAMNFLEQNEIEYQHIDNVDKKLSKTKIKQIHKTSNLEIKKIFNTSGMRYRELNLKDKISNMSDEECYELLASDGMLVKRPILIIDTKALIGFKEKEWIEELL